MLGRAETSDRQRGSVSLRSACRGILRASSLLLSRAARATTPARHLPPPPTYRSSMHRSPPPPPPSPPRPRARSRSPRALHRNTGSIFFPRSCTEHDQPHRCAPPTLVDSATRERIYFSSTTTRPRAHRVLGAIILLVVLLVPMSCASKSLSVNARGKRERLGYNKRLVPVWRCT